MYCAKCGTQIMDAAKFCPACGHDLSIPANTTPIYAGFWARFAAAFVDGFILMIISIPLWVVAAVVFSNDAMAVVGYLLTFIASALYFSNMESGEQSATYGKRWVGLKVFDVEGKRISGGRAFARWASHFFSYVTLYIGFLIQPFTPKKQALHDMIAGTIVVDAKEGKNSSTAVIAIAVAFVAIVFIGILAAVAIPAYQGYVIKAKVAEGVSLGNSASLAVEEYYLRTGKIPASLADVGFSSTTGKYVSDVTVNPRNGTITVTFGHSGQSQLDGKSLEFIPAQNNDNLVSWKCSSTEIQITNLPISCR